MNNQTIRVLATALLAVIACDSRGPKSGALPWGPKRLTELVAGPYKIPIPATWRALSELEDRSMQLPDGFVGMTPERLDRGAMRSNINLTWPPLPSGSELPTCDLLAHAIADAEHATASDIATLSIDGDRGCRFRSTTAEATLLQVARFQGDHELVLTWTRMATLGSEDADGDREVWERTLAALHVPRA